MFGRLCPLAMGPIILIFSTIVWADEATEVEQVRKILEKEQDSWIKGDPEQLMSCYAPSYVGFSANGGRFDLASVTQVGLDTLRANVASQTVNVAAQYAKPGRIHHFEVAHIDIKDDHAIGLTRHWNATPDSTARETIHVEWKSLWMLTKTSGEWKIFSVLGFISAEQLVWKWNPE